MAEDKKELVTLINRGKRHFDTTGPDDKPFRHSPNAVGSYRPEQAAMLLGYPEFTDISKLPGASASNRQLESDNKALLAKQKELEALVASLQAAAGKPAPAEAPAPAADEAPAAEAPAADAPRRGKKS